MAVHRSNAVCSPSGRSTETPHSTQAGKRITPRPSAEPIRVQRSDDNAAVIVVVGQKVAQDAECRASGDTDP
jgi:hypothetical protein